MWWNKVIFLSLSFHSMSSIYNFGFWVWAATNVVSINNEVANVYWSELWMPYIGHAVGGKLIWWCSPVKHNNVQWKWYHTKGLRNEMHMELEWLSYGDMRYLNQRKFVIQHTLTICGGNILENPCEWQNHQLLLVHKYGSLIINFSQTV